MTLHIFSEFMFCEEFMSSPFSAIWQMMMYIITNMSMNLNYFNYS